MVLSMLERALSQAETSFNEAVTGLDPLAKSLIDRPAMLLSRILLGTVCLGGQPPGEKAICACRALEFLERALLLGRVDGADPDLYAEDKLLVADYLYAQAIDQVIGANEPAIIGMLARAIMGTSEDRVAGDFSADRRRLITAALEIGLHLGQITGADGAAVKAATKSSRETDNGEWALLFPAGPIKDHMISLATPAAQS